MTTGGITDGLLPVSKLGDASVVVYIGTQPSDIAQNPESTPHVHVQTFQEVSSISVRKKIAQMMDSTLHNAADDAQFPNTGQPQSIVTAVLRLDNKHHASIDSVLGEVIRLFPDQVLVNCRIIRWAMSVSLPSDSHVITRMRPTGHKTWNRVGTNIECGIISHHQIG